VSGTGARPALLTDRQLATAAHAALDNCEALLEDAQLLLAADRPARAHALAALAVEEFGKHLMCVAHLVRERDSEADRYFLRAFRDHRKKLRNALLQIDVIAHATRDTLDRLMADLSERIQHEAVQKLRGLYVDLDLEGLVSRPDASVTLEDARELLGDVEALLERHTFLRGNTILVDELPPDN